MVPCRSYFAWYTLDAPVGMRDFLCTRVAHCLHGPLVTCFLTIRQAVRLLWRCIRSSGHHANGEVVNGRTRSWCWLTASRGCPCSNVSHWSTHQRRRTDQAHRHVRDHTVRGRVDLRISSSVIGALWCAAAGPPARSGARTGPGALLRCSIEVAMESFAALLR